MIIYYSAAHDKKHRFPGCSFERVAEFIILNAIVDDGDYGSSTKTLAVIRLGPGDYVHVDNECS